MTHVKHAGDVRWRNDDRVCGLWRLRICDETLLIEPELVPLLLDRLRFVSLRNLSHTTSSSTRTRLSPQGLGGSLRYIIVDSDSSPFLFSVGGFDEHPSAGAGAGGRIEDAHLVVFEPDFFERGIEFYESRAKGLIERIHWTVAFGDG